MKGSSFVHISGLVTGMTEHEDRDGRTYAAMTVDAGVGTKRSTPVTVMLFERAYSWSTHYDLVGRHAGVMGTLYMAANSGLVVRAQRIELHDEGMWTRAWEDKKPEAMDADTDLTVRRRP